MSVNSQSSIRSTLSIESHASHPSSFSIPSDPSTPSIPAHPLNTFQSSLPIHISQSSNPSQLSGHDLQNDSPHGPITGQLLNTIKFSPQNTLIDFSNHTQNSISQQVDTLFKNQTIGAIQQNLQTIQTELLKSQNELKETVQARYPQLLNVTKRFNAMHQYADNIITLLKFTPDSEHDETNQDDFFLNVPLKFSLKEVGETNGIGINRDFVSMELENENGVEGYDQASSSDSESFEDYFFIINQFIQEGMVLHATLLTKLIYSKFNNDNDGLNREIHNRIQEKDEKLEEIETQIFTQDILAKSLTYCNYTNRNWFVDLDILQRFLSYFILARTSTHTITSVSLLRSFLDFQTKRLREFNHFHGLEHPSQFGAFVIFEYIFTFVMSHLIFSTNIISVQCERMLSFLQEVVQYSCKSSVFVEYYNGFLWTVVQRYIDQVDLQKIVFGPHSDNDLQILNDEEIECELKTFFEASLPSLELVLNNVLEHCDSTSTSNVLLQTYDQILYILNTCHIRLHQHSHLFDSFDLSRICNRSFVKTVLSTIPEIMERIFREKQSRIIVNTFSAAKSQITSYLSSLPIADNILKPYISGIVSDIYDKNVTNPLHTHLWNKGFAEEILLNRFQKRSIENANQNYIRPIESNSFDPYVKTICNEIFNNILLKKLEFIFHLFNWNDTTDTKVKNSLMSASHTENLMQCIENSLCHYIENSLLSSEIEITEGIDMIKENNINVMYKQLFYGRLIHETQSAIKILTDELEKKTSRKMDIHPLNIKLDSLYCSSLQLWLEFVGTSLRLSLSRTNEYFQVSTSNWVPSVNNDSEEVVYVPHEPSSFIQFSIQLLNDQLFNIGSYMLKKIVIEKLTEKAAKVVTETYFNFLSENESQITEVIALQILFDLKLFASLFFTTRFDRLQSKVHADSIDVPKIQLDFVSLVEKVNDRYIDAINWETYEKQFDMNLRSHLHNYNLMYGMHIANHLDINKRGSFLVNSSLSQFIEVAPSMCAPFQLLAVNKILHNKEMASVIAKESDQSSSRITKFFKGFGW